MVDYVALSTFYRFAPSENKKHLMFARLETAPKTATKQQQQQQSDSVTYGVYYEKNCQTTHSHRNVVCLLLTAWAGMPVCVCVCECVCDVLYFCNIFVSGRFSEKRLQNEAIDSMT